MGYGSCYEDNLDAKGEYRRGSAHIPTKKAKAVKRELSNYKIKNPSLTRLTRGRGSGEDTHAVDRIALAYQRRMGGICERLL